jgi:hypothetical protein
MCFLFLRLKRVLSEILFKTCTIVIMIATENVSIRVGRGGLGHFLTVLSAFETS